MKRLFYSLSFVISLTVAQQLSAQTIQYTYDAAGNRTQRKIVLGNNPDPSPNKKGFIQKDSLGKIGVTIAPNPTAGLLKITMDNYIDGVPAATIMVYDLSGKLIIQKQGITGSAEIDLSPYPAGAYLLKLSAGENTSIWNLVKE